MSDSTRSLPNIVYILADDMGYGDVAVLNPASRIPTPHLDSIAARGMVFTDAHSNSAVCTPTRYGILTGRYAWRTNLQRGVLWSWDRPLIPPQRTTVAGLLRDNGYRTACIGKWHLGLDWSRDSTGNIDMQGPVRNGPTVNGFDYFFGIAASLDIPPYVYIEQDQLTTTQIDTIEATTGPGFWRWGPIGKDFKHEEVLPVFTQRAIQYIEQQAGEDAPFFLYLSLAAPHTPILPTAEFQDRSGTNEYGDFVMMVDAAVGEIVEALRIRGELENTLLVFTSDNGCSLMADLPALAALGHYPSFHFRGHKADIYEGGHRIPFLVQWPGYVAPGRKLDSTICLTDWLATCADIVGDTLAADEGEDSYSMWSLLLDEPGTAPLRPATVHHSVEGCFAIRQGPWKLNFCPGSGGWSSPTPKEAAQLDLPPKQLYRLDQDPGERNNLVADYPEVVTRLSALLQKYIREGRSTPGIPQQNDTTVVIPPLLL